MEIRCSVCGDGYDVRDYNGGLNLAAALHTSKLSEAIQTRAIRAIIAGKIDPKP